MPQRAQKQTPSTPKDVRTIVLMENITSNEHYLYPDGETVPILRGIDLTVEKGQIFGIDGASPFEIRLLLEIIANIRAYGSGRCVLLERGMMRKKRIILPHVFYIGNPNMAYQNMNVLEFLMFALMKRKGDKIALQEKMLDFLIDIGLKNIALTPLYSLPREHKAVVLLLISAFSKSELVVFNFPEYRFIDQLTRAIAGIASLFGPQNKTLVLASQDPDLIQAACTHMAFINDGVFLYAGSVDAFRHTYDNIMLTIVSDSAQTLASALRAELPQYTYDVSGHELIVRSDAPQTEDPRTIYQKITALDIVPSDIRLNPKTVQNAREELLKQYAVH